MGKAVTRDSLEAAHLEELGSWWKEQGLRRGIQRAEAGRRREGLPIPASHPRHGQLDYLCPREIDFEETQEREEAR